MLKIRDDVDLKELEKFGFYKEAAVDDWWFCDFIGDSYPYNEPIYKLSVLEKNNEDYEDAIERVIYCFVNDIPNVVYDLIQAGLVEKVEE